MQSFSPSSLIVIRGSSTFSGMLFFAGTDALFLAAVVAGALIGLPAGAMGVGEAFGGAFDVLDGGSVEACAVVVAAGAMWMTS